MSCAKESLGKPVGQKVFGFLLSSCTQRRFSSETPDLLRGILPASPRRGPLTTSQKWWHQGNLKLAQRFFFCSFASGHLGTAGDKGLFLVSLLLGRLLLFPPPSPPLVSAAWSAAETRKYVAQPEGHTHQHSTAC